MLTAILRQTAKKALLAAVLCGAGMTLVVSSASAQTRAARQFPLSPRARWVLDNIMLNSSQYGQQLVWNALLRIGPERAEAQLAPLSAVPPNQLQMQMQVIGWIMQTAVPPQYYQTFVNGLFQASAEEEQYANRVINGVAQSLNAQGGPSNEDYLHAQRMGRLMTWMTFMNRPR